MFVDFCVLGPCFMVQFSNPLAERERDCLCSMFLPHGAVGWPVVCACNILSNILTCI